MVLLQVAVAKLEIHAESGYGGLKPHLVVSLCSGCRFPLRVARFAELPRVFCRTVTKRCRALQISASRRAGFRFFAFDGLVPVASRQFPVVFRQFRKPFLPGRFCAVQQEPWPLQHTPLQAISKNGFPFTEPRTRAPCAGYQDGTRPAATVRGRPPSRTVLQHCRRRTGGSGPRLQPRRPSALSAPGRS